MPDGRPVAMSQIDMTEGKGSWDKRGIIWVELFFHPEWPYPVKIELNHSRINQPTRLKYHSRSDEFNGLLDFRGLRKLPHSCQDGQRIDKA
jgi:hypothetical protein